MIPGFDPGVHGFELPTSLPTGHANVYLVEDEPLTLIDTGPRDDATLAALVGELEHRGRAIDDIGLILITHGHPDHVGNVARLKEASGAVVAAFAPLAPRLEEPQAAAADDATYRLETMRLHGVPSTASEDARRQWEHHSSAHAPEGFTLDRPLDDGDIVELRGRSLVVTHRPGHSQADILFVDPERSLAFVGDHLLRGIVPPPVAARPLDRSGGQADRYPSQLAYVDSLRKTKALDLSLALGGHGPPIEEPSALIDRRLAQVEQRTEDALERIGDDNVTAWDLVERTWPKPNRPFPMLSAALGLLDLLVAANRLEQLEGAPIRFRRAKVDIRH